MQWQGEQQQTSLAQGMGMTVDPCMGTESMTRPLCEVSPDATQNKV